MRVNFALYFVFSLNGDFRVVLLWDLFLYGVVLRKM